MGRVVNASGAAFADASLGGGSDSAELVAVLLVLEHLVVRDSLAGHAVYLRLMFESSTVAPPPGPARCRPLTGQHSCRQPAQVIVVNHTGEYPLYGCPGSKRFCSLAITIVQISARSAISKASSASMPR